MATHCRQEVFACKRILKLSKLSKFGIVSQREGKVCNERRKTDGVAVGGDRSVVFFIKGPCKDNFVDPLLGDPFWRSTTCSERERYNERELREALVDKALLPPVTKGDGLERTSGFGCCKSQEKQEDFEVRD